MTQWNRIIGISLASCALMLSACSKSSSSSSGGSGTRNEEVKPITTLSDCQNGRSVRSLTETDWFTEYASESLRFVWELQVGPNQMTILNHCSYRNSNAQLTARVSTQYIDNGSSFNWLNEDKDVAEYNDGQFRANCSMNVKPMRISYKFVGSCLVLSNPNGSDMVFRSR